MNRRLGAACATALAACALLAAGSVTAAQALPTCASGYAPTGLSGASNAAAAATALTVSWKIPTGVKKELMEQKVEAWVAAEARSDGRKVNDTTTSARSFTFDNLGEKGEMSSGSEADFIEPGTSYDLAVTAVYGASTKYPEGCAAETTGASVATRRIFGTNGGLCCSREMSEGLVKNAETLVGDGIASDRVQTNDDPETEAEETYGNTPKLAYEHHFVNNDVIVGDVEDGEPLGHVTISTWAKEAREQVENAAKYGDVLMEVGNEMFLKGGVAEPVRYGEMYLALLSEVQKAKEAKAVPGDVKLLYNLFGDYYLGEDKWSNANEGRGWLGEAVKALPELKTKIEGFTFHPYDVNGATLAEEEGYMYYEYDWALRGLKEDDKEAGELGVKHTNVYATEFGICVNKEYEEENCTSKGALKSEAEDLKEAETDYDELLDTSEFPEVKGLWWFQAYPVEDKYSFFKGWGGGEATKLVKLVKELSKKG